MSARHCPFLFVVVTSLALWACGGSGKTATTPSGGGGDAGTEPAPPVTDGGGEPGDAPVTEAECSAFFDHVLALQLAEMRTKLPPDEVPTDVQVEEIKKKMVAEEMGNCVKQPRALLECAMAATTVKDIRSCQPPAPAP